MKDKPESSRMYSLIVLYDMHTEFFPKAVAGIPGKDANSRLGTKANSMAWIAGSFVHERFETAKLMGGSKLEPSFYELFKDHQGIREGVTYPTFEEYQKELDKISPVLREILLKTTDEALDKIFEMEGMKMPYYDLTAFMTYREANCIGQLALWRRLLGHEAMKYM